MIIFEKLFIQNQDMLIKEILKMKLFSKGSV